MRISRQFSRHSEPTIMRVLFVEDDMGLCDAFSALAKASGHIADVAYDGQQAMLLATQHCYDTIFLDIGLPDVDGRELCRQLRASGASKLACVVAVTGDDRHKEIQQEFFDGYFLKPFTEESLRAALNSCG
jgi:two-component system, OmpR family, response regulator